jgi:nucleotide-binding universal stress UspA family protein
LYSYLEEMVRFSQKSLEEVALNRISPNLKVRTIVLQGNPADRIVELARSEKVDMIVTATHGLTGWRRFIFGSVAERVVRFASCPVLTVPAPLEEQEE